MFGGGDQVGAQVVLSADNSGYNTAMQQSAGITDRLGQSYDNLKAKIDRGFTHVQHASMGIAAADVASLTAATIAAGRYQDKMRQLQAQSNVLNQSFGQGQARMRDYENAVNSVRTSFGETTSAAAQLVQTISGFERAGSTQGLAKMAADFEKMSQTTGENASALAQSVLSLDQAMGSGLKQAKAYSDQLVTMSEISNTNAESLANFAAQIAPLGRQLNMTQSEITGFAAAFSKAGQDGYRASNVFSQMTSDIAQSLQTNSPRLRAYAQLLGVTTAALKGMSGAQVTSGLFDAIGRRGSSSLQTLNELGYDGLNVTRVISAVTQQSGGVGNMIRLANGAYGDKSSGAGGQTASQQFAKLGQDLMRDGEIIGSKFLPALQGVMTLVDKLASGFTSFMQGPGGELVAVIGAVIAPLGLLVSGLVSLHGVIMPLLTIMAVRRSALGHGLVEGFRGGSKLGAGGEIGMGLDMVNDPRLAGRPMTRKFYDFGQGLGARARFTGTGSDRLSDRMRWVLGVDKVKAAEGGTAAALTAEEEAAAAAAGPGIFTRGGRALARWVVNFGIKPTVEPGIEPRPLGRQPMPTFGLFGRSKQAGASASELGAAEAQASNETRSFTQAVRQGAVSMKDWVSAQVKGLAETTAATIATSAAADAETTLAAESAKLNVAMGASAAATEEQASAMKVATATIMQSAKEAAALAGGGYMGAVRGGFAGAKTLGGIGARGLSAGIMAGAEALGAMGPMGWGMLAMMGLPMLSGPLHSLLDVNKGSLGPGPTDVGGTGLSFGISGVVAPVPQGGPAPFNPMAPTPAQAYAAGERKDFANPGVRNIRTPEQAAGIFGSVWDSLGPQNQASLGQDLLGKLGYADYQKFLALMKSGQYSTFGRRSAAAAAGAQGGLSMAFSSLQQSQAGQTNVAGNNFRDLMSTFLSAPRNVSIHNKNGLLSWLDAGPGNGSFSTYGMGQMNTVGRGPFGFFSGTTYSLTGTGMDFASKLYGGTPSGSAQSRLGKVLYNMPKGLNSQDQLAYILKHVSKDDLARAMQQQGLEPTGNQKADLSAVVSALNTKSVNLPSAFAGFGLSDTQAHEVQSLDSTKPGDYAAKLYGNGLTQARLSQLSLQAGALIPGTIQAVQQYGANQLSLLSPFLTPQQQLLGSNSGLPGVSGMNAGMISTGLTPFNGQFSLLGQAQGALSTAQGLAATGDLSGNADAMNALQSSANSVVQAYTSQLQSMKQYQMSLDQLNFSSQQYKQSMAWQAQQEALQVSREKQDQARNVGREEYSFNLQRKRAEADFQRSRKYAEEDYHLQRSRAMQDFAHQTTMMIKQASMSMMDVYRQNPAQGFTSAQFLLYNNAQQTSLMNRQESQLTKLRGMGLSKDAIQQLGLTSSNNNQELNGLFQQIQANPALIDQLNSAVQQRLSAAGALATDASSMSYQEQVYQFNLSLDRGAADFAKSMKRSANQFDIQMARSSQDFARQMGQQESDFLRQLGRQQKDYNTSVSHSWTTFTRGVANSMKQMNAAAAPLTDTANQLSAIAKKFGDSNIGKQAQALQAAIPQIMTILNKMSQLLQPNQPTSGPKEPLFVKFLDIMGSQAAHSGSGGGSPLGVSATTGGGLPPAIAQRMAADQPTSGYCLRDVEDVLAAGHYSPTAYAAWQNAKGHRHLMNGLIPAPIGAPIFFGPEYGGGDGHVAINAGYGMMWSEDAGNRWEKKPIWPGVLGWSDRLDGVTVAPTYGQQGFAKGTWNLPADMIAQIHKGEMIIPAKVAEVVRQVVTKGQVASLHAPAHPVYSHIDARSYTTHEETNFTGPVTVTGVQNPQQMFDQMSEMARLKALVKR